jgi:uridine monophosphate synthetase
MEEEAQLKHLVLRINEIGAVKFGQFKLKTGVISPIYFDLRVLVSFPDILSLAVDIIWHRLQKSSRSADFVCGVPYTALPIASVLSVKYSVRPTVFKSVYCYFHSFKMDKCCQSSNLPLSFSR